MSDMKTKVMTVLACMLLTTTAMASVSLYNYSLTNYVAVKWQSMENGSTQLAQTFKTGGSLTTLSNVSIWIRNATMDDYNSYAGTLSVALFATDGDSKPTGSALYVITNGMYINEWYDNGPNTPGTVWNDLDYELLDNTTYAMVFTPSGSASISWKYPASGHPTSDIAAVTFYNWQHNGTNWSAANPGTTNGFNMMVTAMVIPEPVTGVMIAGLAALGVRRLRSRG
ncbi:MAG: hypothetical protein NTV22_05565 [bacterium]|nr:hypothetical protein [bacterium]